MRHVIGFYLSFFPGKLRCNVAVGDSAQEKMETAKIACLAQIQGVINRMSSISMTCKGFSATMFAGVLAILLSMGNSNNIIVWILTAVPIVAFACFDAYYFSKELQYRDLYYDVLYDEAPVDFNMTVGKVKLTTLGRAIKSKSIYLFYLVFVCCYVVLAILINVGIV